MVNNFFVITIKWKPVSNVKSSKGVSVVFANFPLSTFPSGGACSGILKIDRAPEPGYRHGQGLLFPDHVYVRRIERVDFLLTTLHSLLKTTPTHSIILQPFVVCLSKILRNFPFYFFKTTKT